jgi:uncharacterized protein
MTVIYELQTSFRSSYQLHMLRFGSGRPTVAIVAGLHGNELNGIHSLNMLTSALRMQKLKGSVLLFPLVNTFGADEGSKRWPLDDQDINKTFPGDAEGTPTERICAALLEATKEAEVCIDVHSGAAHVREYPQVRCPLSGREVELARAMKMPVIWRRAGEHFRVTGLVGAWRARGQTALHVIGGRGITLDTALSTTMAACLSNLLSALGMMRSMMKVQTIADVTSSEIMTHRAGCGGFFVPEVRVGDLVEPGRLLGYLQAPIGGDRLDEIRTEKTGVVMTLRANPMTFAQELLARIAETG